MKNFGIRLLLVTWLIVLMCHSNQVYSKALTERQAIVKVLDIYEGEILKSTVIVKNNVRYVRVRLLLRSGRIISVLVNTITGKLQKE